MPIKEKIKILIAIRESENRRKRKEINLTSAQVDTNMVGEVHREDEVIENVV